MPGMSGLELIRRLKQVQPRTAVVVMTMYDSPMYVREALRAGAAGYVIKDSSDEVICRAVKAAVDGLTMVRSDLLLQAIRAGSPDDVRPISGQSHLAIAELTARELDVLRLVAQGHLNKEIAKELSLAEVTVKKHVQAIMAKLRVSDRTNAAILAVRLGLVE
jgi:DNA-binding NarL/FixJ family response regulator